MTYNVFGGTLNLAQPQPVYTHYVPTPLRIHSQSSQLYGRCCLFTEQVSSHGVRITLILIKKNPNYILLFIFMHRVVARNHNTQHRKLEHLK